MYYTVKDNCSSIYNVSGGADMNPAARKPISQSVKWTVTALFVLLLIMFFVPNVTLHTTTGSDPHRISIFQSQIFSQNLAGFFGCMSETHWILSVTLVIIVICVAAIVGILFTWLNRPFIAMISAASCFVLYFITLIAWLSKLGGGYWNVVMQMEGGGTVLVKATVLCFLAPYYIGWIVVLSLTVLTVTVFVKQFRLSQKQA